MRVRELHTRYTTTEHNVLPEVLDDIFFAPALVTRSKKVCMLAVGNRFIHVKRVILAFLNSQESS